MIQGAPPDVVDASRRLACSTCVLVNIGVDREDLSDAHMTYFYDEDICFTRLSFPHMLSANNVPPGAGSIQAEVYFSEKYRPLTGSPEDWIEPVISRPPPLRDPARRRHHLDPRGNVAPIRQRDLRPRPRRRRCKTVHGYLDDIGIAYCGRHGDWGYMWTDESFKSGEKAAEGALATAACRQGSTA